MHARRNLVPVGSRRAAYLAMALLAIVALGSALSGPPRPVSGDQLTSLPGGTAMLVGISSPAPGAVLSPGLVEITGYAEIAHLGPVKDTTVVFIVDRSGSMAADSETDCDGDGTDDTNFDCVRVGIDAANQAAASTSSNVALTGLAAFWECPVQSSLLFPADLTHPDPGEAFHLLAPPGTDGNNNGVVDLIEAWEHPFMQPAGHTCLGAGVWAAGTLLAVPENDSARNIVVYLSDGVDNMTAPPVGFASNTTVLAFAAPGGACTFGTSTGPLNLDKIAELGNDDSSCQELDQWDEIGEAIAQAIVPAIVDLDVEIDGDGAGLLAVTPHLPAVAPAAVSFTAFEVLEPGEHEICARAEGQDWGGAGAVTECITVTVLTPTVLTYDGDVTQDYHDDAFLAATLTDGAAAPIPGETVDFVLGTQSCSGVTDASGRASCTITLGQVPGDYQVNATFAGNGLAESSDSAPFMITPQETTVVYTGPAGGVYHELVTLSATLTEEDAPPLAGQVLTFSLGTQSCGGITDGDGNASCSFVLNQVPGDYTVDATFTGTAFYEGSVASQAFGIEKAPTTLQYTGPTLIADGQSITLAAALKEGTSTAPDPSGQAVELSLGEGGGAQSCTAVVDTAGDASCIINPVAQPLGSGSVTASFAGDSYYLPSVSNADVLVFANLASGAFVIGDLSAEVGTTAYWWDPKWSKKNALTGGEAPSEFKGFASSTSSPPACGSAWTAGPGNSQHPPQAVPDYMAVIVSSAISKSGSTTTGNVMKIVIVKAAPGYGSGVGHAGSGEIVAELC